jgi:hypothetical protein
LNFPARFGCRWNPSWFWYWKQSGSDDENDGPLQKELDWAWDPFRSHMFLF